MKVQHRPAGQGADLRSGGAGVLQDQRAVAVDGLDHLALLPGDGNEFFFLITLREGTLTIAGIFQPILYILPTALDDMLVRHVPSYDGLVEWPFHGADPSRRSRLAKESV